MMRAAYVAGIANAQRVAREAILSVAQTVKPGDTERGVCARLEREFRRARVQHWLHTPYAWWGERTRFDWRGVWETNALPSERALEVGEAFILDAAPIVRDFPADFAYSGVAGTENSSFRAELLDKLASVKQELLLWANPSASAASVCEQVEQSIGAAGMDIIHTRYPANVLGHSLEGFPNWCSRAPRIGTGFQLTVRSRKWNLSIARRRRRRRGSRHQRAHPVDGRRGAGLGMAQAPGARCSRGMVIFSARA